MTATSGKPYLSRTFDSILSRWKDRKGHLPLIVTGARQVGKTESIRQFARPRYESFVEVNFVERPAFKGIVRDGFSADAIRRNLTLVDPSIRLPEGRTLLFFDEIQDAPEVATALKFLAQDGRCDVICSGSLLGAHYKRIPSVSVGYQETVEMRSLDFREFLVACGYPPELPDEWLGRLVDAAPFSALECETFGRLFIDYCTLGGMPDVLSGYFSNRSFEGTLAAQRRILADYRADVRKYAEGLDQARILSVFDAIPAQLAKENRKFQISKVAHGARFREYWGCVEWLRDAGVANVCHALNLPELPVKGNVNPSRYKLYMADSGLLVAQLDDEAQLDVRARRHRLVEARERDARDGLLPAVPRPARSGRGQVGERPRQVPPRPDRRRALPGRLLGRQGRERKRRLEPLRLHDAAVVRLPAPAASARGRSPPGTRAIGSPAPSPASPLRFPPVQKV